MAEFPVEKEEEIEIKVCGKPENAKIPFLIDAAALQKAREEIKSAVDALIKASPEGFASLAQKLSVAVTGDTIQAGVNAVIDGICNLMSTFKPKVVGIFSVSKCCPAKDAEFTTPAPPELPSLGPLDIKATWEAYPPGDPIACNCQGGGKGECREQWFTLTWIFTISISTPVTFSYPITAQINTFGVKSPCCCPKPSDTGKSGGGSEPSKKALGADQPTKGTKDTAPPPAPPPPPAPVTPKSGTGSPGTKAPPPVNPTPPPPPTKPPAVAPGESQKKKKKGHIEVKDSNP
jgi:hypothetical protein